MATQEVKEKQEVIAEINGLILKTNSLYKITPKLDKMAPDGFQSKGSTKLPSDGIFGGVSCGMSDDSSMYDTGFYEGSKCYAGMTAPEQKKVVSAVAKYIVTPYEKLTNHLGILNQTNMEFWDSYSVKLENGRVFNTSNVKDLLDLYIAMRAFALTPDSMLGSPKFSTSQFMIKDTDYSLSVSQERTIAKATALGSIIPMYENDNEKLFYVLKDIGLVKLFEKPSVDSLITNFDAWLSRDVQNADIFNKAIASLKDKDSYTKIVLSVKIKMGIYKKKIVKEVNTYVFNGVPLGKDVQSCVAEVMRNKDLKELQDDIMML